jgi:hypothetical protein
MTEKQNGTMQRRPSSPSETVQLCFWPGYQVQTTLPIHWLKILQHFKFFSQCRLNISCVVGCPITDFRVQLSLVQHAQNAAILNDMDDTSTDVQLLPMCACCLCLPPPAVALP